LKTTDPEFCRKKAQKTQKGKSGNLCPFLRLLCLFAAIFGLVPFSRNKAGNLTEEASWREDSDFPVESPRQHPSCEKRGLAPFGILSCSPRMPFGAWLIAPDFHGWIRAGQTTHLRRLSPARPD
jgi:hypothetical protein